MGEHPKSFGAHASLILISCLGPLLPLKEGIVGKQWKKGEEGVEETTKGPEEEEEEFLLPLLPALASRWLLDVERK